jgi:outer membrane receptor protein involved in Fe transport
VNYAPDLVGDLIYKGIASQIHHGDEVVGSQIDASYRLSNTHTLRMGLFAQHENAFVLNTSSVFPADSGGTQTSSVPETIQDNTRLGGNLVGAYLQDEWHTRPELTLNMGLRYDHVNTVTDAMQWSPRLGVVYDLSSSTRVHAGYARYFTPPPTELINPRSLALFANTTNALPSNANTAVTAERSHYLDLGVSHLLSKSLTLGLDAYYREVRHLQDEGQFGNALIYSAFNYAQGRVAGIEWSANYRQGPLAANLNLTRAVAQGRGLETGQFNFPFTELTYINNHWVHLDHDQTWTSSGSASYRQGDNHYFLDWTAGTGLRNGFANTDHLPGYWQWNAAVSHDWSQSAVGTMNLRLTVVNLLDRVYELRDGTGIGVGAPQYGQRRTFYLSLSHPFGS